MRTPSITSPYAPDVEKVRAWLQEMIAALRFVEIVAAIVALIGDSETRPRTTSETRWT